MGPGLATVVGAFRREDVLLSVDDPYASLGAVCESTCI